MRILVCGDEASIEEFKKHLLILAERVKRVVRVIKDGFTSLLKALVEVPDVDRVVRQQKRECKNTVSAARAKAITFMDFAYRVFQYADIDIDNQQAMKEAYKNGDTKRVKNFAEQIKKCLQKCDESYKEFLDAYAKAKVMCGKIADECGVKRASAQENKHLKIAGAVAGAALAVATAPFTFGGSIIVGLSAAAAVLVSSVASLSALASAVKDAHMEKIFEEICESMDTASEDLGEIDSSLRFISEKLKVISFDVETILQHVNEKQVYEDFCRVFDLLITGIKSGRQTFDEYYSTVYK